jgi:hypothetical protein
LARDDALFCAGDLDATLRAQAATLSAKVDAIPQDQLMNAPEDELVEHIVAQLSVEPLMLYEDRAQLDQHEARLDVSDWPSRNHFREPGPIYVPAVQVIVMMPYSGDPQLWRLRPNQWLSVYPRAVVINKGQPSAGTLVFDLVQPADEDPAKFKTTLDLELKTIRHYIEAQRKQVDAFNGALAGQARAAIQARRARIEKHMGIESLLGIPLKRKDGAPDTTPIPMQRKLVRPLPPPPKSGYKPEPGIRDQDYEHILSVIRHEGRTYEATPSTYAVHDEEQLRDIVLAHLNGHYQGDATGETFRRSGKTDIRIEDGDRAAFVAECKIWRGTKELGEAIDQLLGYLTWRDCKTAVVVFNKHNKGFSGILENIPNVFKTHPNYRSTGSSDTAGEWQFMMTSKEDDGRFVRVHVFAFNLYAG